MKYYLLSHDVVTFDVDSQRTIGVRLCSCAFWFEICCLDVGRTATFSNFTPSRLDQVIFNFIKGEILFHVLRISGKHSHTSSWLTALPLVVCLFLFVLHVKNFSTRNCPCHVNIYLSLTCSLNLQGIQLFALICCYLHFITVSSEKLCYYFDQKTSNRAWVLPLSHLKASLSNNFVCFSTYFTGPSS